MPERLVGGRRFIIRARIDVGEYWLCALWDDGETVRGAINDQHVALAIVHAERHVERGFNLVQLCSIHCPG